jgi:hypothetical protein
VTSTDKPLEQATVHEVAGVFRTAAAMQQAVDALLLAGFDRADVDLMADVETIQEKLGGMFVPADEIADMPGAPRKAYVAREDLVIPIAGATGILFYLGATAMALSVVASGGTLAAAVAAAALGGAFGGGIGALGARFIGREQARKLEQQLMAGGLVVWVRARTPDQEERAADILRGHGADAVHVHDITIDRHLEDVPLASVRPDPWLSDEPLGTSDRLP